MKDRGLAGQYNADGSITFSCDDCGLKHRISTIPNKLGLRVFNPGGLRPWSVTKRKQRCPDCTVVAKAKGWVK